MSSEEEAWVEDNGTQTGHGLHEFPPRVKQGISRLDIPGKVFKQDSVAIGSLSGKRVTERGMLPQNA